MHNANHNCYIVVRVFNIVIDLHEVCFAVCCVVCIAYARSRGCSVGDVPLRPKIFRIKIIVRAMGGTAIVYRLPTSTFWDCFPRIMCLRCLSDVLFVCSRALVFCLILFLIDLPMLPLWANTRQLNSPWQAFLSHLAAL